MKHYLKAMSVLAAAATIALCGSVGTACAVSVVPDFFLESPASGVLPCTLAYENSVQHNPYSAIPLYTFTAPAKLTLDANSRTYAYASYDSNATVTYSLCYDM